MNTQSEQHINASFLGNETESFLNSRLEGAKVQVVDDDTLHVDVTNPLCVTYTPQSEDDLFDRRFQDAYHHIVEAMKAITPAAHNYITIQSSHKQFNAYNPHKLLQNQDIDLLEKVDLFNYPLLRYANLAALHREVIVVISNDTPHRPSNRKMKLGEMKKELDDIEREISFLENKANRTIEDEHRLEALRSMRQIYKDKINEAENNGINDDGDVDVEISTTISRLGEYIRVNPNDPPIIKLYRNNISSCEELACTYVHEMMHAYYDTDKSLPSSQHYIKCLEEPLAELGALRFMKKFNRTMYDNYLRDVEGSKHSPSICFYGFGAYLSGVLQDTTLPELMCRQPKPINGIAVSEYEKIWKTHIYPFNTEASTAKKMFAIFIAANMGQICHNVTPVGANLDESKLYEICDAILQLGLGEIRGITGTSFWAFILSSLHHNHYFQGRANRPAYTQFINIAHQIETAYNFPHCPQKSTLSEEFASCDPATGVQIPKNLRDCINETLN